MRYKEKKKWSNLVKLLKDVGRFKGTSEELERQRCGPAYDTGTTSWMVLNLLYAFARSELTAEIDRMNEQIYGGNVHEAQKILESLKDRANLLSQCVVLLPSSYLADLSMFGAVRCPGWSSCGHGCRATETAILFRDQ